MVPVNNQVDIGLTIQKLFYSSNQNIKRKINVVPQINETIQITKY